MEEGKGCELARECWEEMRERFREEKTGADWERKRQRLFKEKKIRIKNVKRGGRKGEYDMGTWRKKIRNCKGKKKVKR